MLEWAGGRFQPEEFDVRVNSILASRRQFN